MIVIRCAWRWTADPRPILYLDFIVSDEQGWRMESFPAYQLVAAMAKELNR